MPSRDAPSLRDLGEQRFDVLGPPHERQRHHVRVFRHERQVRNVLCRQRRHVELRLRQVDALFRPELRGAAGDRRDLGPQAVRGDAADRAADLAVVEEDRLADADPHEDLRQRTGHEGRLQQVPVVVANRVPAGHLAAHEVERVAGPQRDPLLGCRQRADGAFRDQPRLAPQRKVHSRHDVRRRIGLAQAFAGAGSDDAQQALAVAGVGERDRIAGLRFREQRARDGYRRLVAAGFASRRDEPHARGRRHASERVAHRPPLRDRGPGLDRAGAELGSGQVEGQRAALAGLALGLMQTLDHSLPDRGAVVRAVDAHDLHAGLDEVADQRRLVGRLARHRHHDPGRPATARRPEDRVRVRREQRVTAAERDRWRCANFGRNRLLTKRAERLLHRLQRGHHVRLHAAQRAQAESGKLALQLADVEAADGEIVDEVVGALRASTGATASSSTANSCSAASAARRSSSTPRAARSRRSDRDASCSVWRWAVIASGRRRSGRWSAASRTLTWTPVALGESQRPRNRFHPGAVVSALASFTRNA